MTEMHQKVEQSPLPVKLAEKNKQSGFTDSQIVTSDFFLKRNPLIG